MEPMNANTLCSSGADLWSRPRHQSVLSAILHSLEEEPCVVGRPTRRTHRKFKHFHRVYHLDEQKLGM